MSRADTTEGLILMHIGLNDKFTGAFWNTNIRIARL